MSATYRALTRKYRPSSFEDIVSQEHVSNTLRNAIEKDRLAHAYMFCGPRGVGKTTMARVLARTINQIGGEVDGEALNNTLNIIEIDAASNNKVEDVHRVRESVRIPPQNGRFKVYIIDEVHMMSKSAFNALLKTLEEPPPHVIFIFATTEPHKVLPTILSRVQRFDFRRIKVEKIVDRLRKIAADEGVTIDEESLHVIAKKADGALRDALGLLDQAIAFCGDTIEHEALLSALNVVGTEKMFELTQAIIDKDSVSGMSLLDDLIFRGHDLQEFLVSLTEHFRNLYIARSGGDKSLIEASEDTRDTYMTMAGLFSAQDLMRLLHIVSEAQLKIKEAHQPRIFCEISILKLINMTRVDALQQLMDEIQELKKNFSSEIAPAQKIPTERSASNGKPSDKNERDETEPQAPSDSPSEKAFQERETKQKKPKKPLTPKPSSGSLIPDFEPALKRKKKAESVPSEETETRTESSDAISANGVASHNSTNEQAAQTEQSNVEESSTHTDSWINEDVKVTLDDITSIWKKFLQTIEGELNQTVYLMVERTRPHSVEDGTFYLEVNDTFQERLVNQHSRTINKNLNPLLKGRVEVQAKLIQKEKPEEEQDIYTRFKKLQKKDPKIRTLIELFGAELEF